MLEYSVVARRVDAHGSEARTKDAAITLDTDVKGRPDAFNPAELFLAAIAACMIKGIERVTPILKFELRGVEVKLHGVRQDSPPKLVSVDYELIVDTDESDHRLELLHTNVRKFGTVYNTVAAATALNGRISRRGPA
ncbi:MAG TPA: OsmC family protein [Phenylobacterium sp.]|nr:OsmC family protein [Phenylobacterium sp.]